MAAEPAAPSPTTTDKQGSAHDFDFLVGRWTVEHRRLKARLEHSIQRETFSGTCETRLILGGQGNVHDNVVELPAGGYRAVTVRVFDIAKKSRAIWWLDSRHPHELDPPGATTLLDDPLLASVDTIVVISFDSLRTGQSATASEIEGLRRFLQDPDHLIFICPHHDIGEASGLEGEARTERQITEHLHHGDKAIPPRQGFGGFARTLLAGLGVPIDNRFGLRPAVEADGSPVPIAAEGAHDQLGLLEGVRTFNAHPHLPQLERIGDSLARMEVLASQRIDLSAPAHPFTQPGRASFDALLQSRPDAFAGKLLVCDTTLFSSTAGGTESLSRLWSNVIRRPKRA